ncbi:MAG TPA: CoA ester lyase [Natronosporangium sp.]
MPIRSYLYVAGHDEHRIGKAYASAADAVVLDLEDAVPVEHKDRARRVVRERLSEPPAKPTWVRVNAPDSAWWTADLEAVAGLQLAGLRIPKCETPEAIGQAAAALPADPAAGIQPLIESALGLRRAFELAGCHDRVQTLSLGEADLRADLRVDDEGLDYARAHCVLAARAAGRASPVQSVYITVSDLAGLRASSLRGRAYGFFGRSAVHPHQLDVINEVFGSQEDRDAAARRLIAEAEAAGGHPFIASDGRFVDPAVLRAARDQVANSEGRNAGT